MRGEFEPYLARLKALVLANDLPGVIDLMAEVTEKAPPGDLDFMGEIAALGRKVKEHGHP